jgi:hypothetical protein
VNLTRKYDPGRSVCVANLRQTSLWPFVPSPRITALIRVSGLLMCAISAIARRPRWRTPVLARNLRCLPTETSVMPGYSSATGAPGHRSGRPRWHPSQLPEGHGHGRPVGLPSRTSAAGSPRKSSSSRDLISWSVHMSAKRVAVIRRTSGIAERSVNSLLVKLNHAQPKGALVVAAPRVEVPGTSGWRRPGLNSCAA